MQNKSRVIVSLTIIVGLIFLIRHLAFFPGVIGTTDRPGMYLLLFAIGLILFGITFFILFKYVLNENQEALVNLEFATACVQLISVIFLLLVISGFPTFFRITYYTGYVLLLLGGVGYYKYKHRINLSSLAWGIFILLLLHYYASCARLFDWV